MSKIVLFSSYALIMWGCVHIQPAVAGETFIAQKAPKPAKHRVTGTMGLGLLGSNLARHPTYSVILEGQNHLKQRMTALGYRQYGQGASRVELGAGAGLAMAASTGVTVFGLAGNAKFAPHLGLEPFSGRLSLHSSRLRKSFYEWTPTASLGIQLQAGTCRLLPLLMRAGFAAGNLSHQGLLPRFRPAYGPAVFLNCHKLDFAADILRVSPAAAPLDLVTIDFAIPVSGSTWKIGFRGEAMVGGAPSNPAVGVSGGNELSERRFMLVVRNSPFL